MRHLAALLSAVVGCASAPPQAWAQFARASAAPRVVVAPTVPGALAAPRLGAPNLAAPFLSAPSLSVSALPTVTAPALAPTAPISPALAASQPQGRAAAAPARPV
ncbi:MAG: hypothetical protein FD126_2872, partial [Elusimicrobia bacterium]